MRLAAGLLAVLRKLDDFIWECPSMATLYLSKKDWPAFEKFFWDQLGKRVDLSLSDSGLPQYKKKNIKEYVG